MYILKKENLNEMLDRWAGEFAVYSPQNQDGQVMLLPYDRNDFTMDYINFAYPVKEYLFKEKEQLFEWKKDNGDIVVKNPEYQPSAFQDLQGILSLLGQVLCPQVLQYASFRP